jgi:hypothetical protein
LKWERHPPPSFRAPVSVAVLDASPSTIITKDQRELKLGWMRSLHFHQQKNGVRTPPDCARDPPTEIQSIMRLDLLIRILVRAARLNVGPWRKTDHDRLIDETVSSIRCTIGARYFLKVKPIE